MTPNTEMELAEPVGPRMEKLADKGKLTAKNADLHWLYEKSVQTPDIEVVFIDKVFRKEFGRPATFLREDFCGTALMCAEWVKYKKPSVLGIVTGMVAGLGTITPASGFVGPAGALLIGLTAGVVCYSATAYLKHTLKIDDSLDVLAVHGIGGATGTLLVAFLAVLPGGTASASSASARRGAPPPRSPRAISPSHRSNRTAAALADAAESVPRYFGSVPCTPCT